MVTFYEETPITLQQAAAMLPGNKGKATHPETVRRWITRGLNGVQLYAKRQGGRYILFPSAVRRFIDQLTAMDQEAAVVVNDGYLEAQRLLREHGINF